MPGSKQSPWYAKGLKFECTGCGGCCHARGEYSYVYVSPAEARAIAARMGLPTHQFVDEYLQDDKDDDGAQKHLRFDAGACSLLVDNRCSVYDDRPRQCRTWPFWRENLDRKIWDTEIAPLTPGVGRGRVWTQAEIEAIAAEDES